MSGLADSSDEGSRRAQRAPVSPAPSPSLLGGVPQKGIGPYFPLVLVVSAGLLVSLALSVTIEVWHRARLQEEFNQAAGRYAEVLERGIGESLDVVRGIRNLYAASQNVERQGFRAFLQETLSHHPEIRALGWVPRVLESDRAAFEETAWREGFPDFQFTEQDAQGHLVRASMRKAYFPVFYVEPFEERQALLGFDYGSNVHRREAMERARETGTAAGTSWLPLVDDPDQYGLIVFQPIYRIGMPHGTLEERRQHLAGFATVVFRITDVVDTSLMPLGRGDIDVYLYDKAETGDGSPVYVRDARGSRIVPWTQASGRLSRRDGLRWATVLEVGGRNWELQCRSTPQFMDAHRSWAPWAVLAIGLLATLLVGGYFFLTISQSTEVERLVLERTRDLRTANNQLRKEIAEREEIERRLQDQAKTLERSNAELAERDRVMRSLLEDLETSKQRLEEQSELLKKTNTQLEEMAALKDDFISKVSHELRTPLTSIKEGLGLLIDNALGETTAEQQDFLKTMDGDIDRLAEMINNMLDIAKIEAGRMRLNRARVEVRELIDSLVRSCKPLLATRYVRVESRERLEVFIDRNRMIQVLTNLLSNAIKVTPDEGAITFRAFRKDGMVAIAVQDEGPGISPEDLPKLFQKFSQVGPQGAGRVRGTGLGLVVCKELAECHGGSINVESELGRGTTFTVMLPAYSDDFALRESFLDLAALTPSAEEGQAVCLVAIQAASLLDHDGAGAEEQREHLERLAREIAQHLHRGDLVLTHEPSWIVALALARPEDTRSIVARLRRTVSEGSQLHFGVAVYPTDGADPLALFVHASSHLDQELVVNEPVQGASLQAGGHTS